MLKKILFTTKNAEKSAYIWNSCASMLSAFQTVFILMVISRIDPVMDAGIFTIAFAIGNLMYTLGMYGIRQFQASDVTQKYSFHEYLVTRYITCTTMIVASIVYVGINYFIGLYSVYKSTVILLVCLFKATDTLEDVFHGLLQQNGRLDIAGKILTLRLSAYIIVYLCCYLNTANLVISSLCGFLVSLFIFIIVDNLAIQNFPEMGKTVAGNKIIKLLLECLPLFVSMYLAMYIANAPKYAIDKVLSSEAQANFSYIFMPVFVIGLLSQFVYQPIIGKLSIMWEYRNRQDFYRLLRYQMLIILLLAVVALIGGYLLGIPLLSLIYGVDLYNYRIHLVILLMGGGFLAYIYLFQMVMTVIRQQKWLVAGYSLVYIIFIIGGRTIVSMYGLMGICLFYTINMALLAVIFAVMVFVRINACFYRNP